MLPLYTAGHSYMCVFMHPCTDVHPDIPPPSNATLTTTHFHTLHSIPWDKELAVKVAKLDKLHASLQTHTDNQEPC